MFGSQDQKDRKTASSVTKTSFGQKITTAQIRSATIANLVELIDERTTMNTTRWLNQPHNLLKNEKNCTTKDRIKDKHIEWHISET